MTASRSKAPTLRDYQQWGVAGIRKAYSDGYRAPLYVLSTGGGKTVLFGYIAATASVKGKRTLVLVHRDKLLRQGVMKIQEFGVRVGAISPQFTPDLRAPVQVGMVQTMVNRKHLYKHFDLIVIDEAHHTPANTYQEVLSYYPDAYQLHVTASPCRSDGKGLGVNSGGNCDTLIMGPQTRWLIDEGYLTDARIFSPPTEVDLSGLRTTKTGDWSAKQVLERIDKKSITGNAVDYYASMCHQEPAVYFGVSVQHCEHIAADFRERGYNFHCIHGKMNTLEINNLLRALGDGSIHGLTACDLISEGLDIPIITAVGLLRPTQSLGLHIQQVGRPLRPVFATGYDTTTRQGRLAAIANGPKPKAIIFDHVGNVGYVANGQYIEYHGAHDKDRDWSLDGDFQEKRGKQDTERAQPIHQCQECYNVYRAHLRQCPHCGHEREFAGRKVDTKEGELVELTPEQKAKISREKRSEVGKARTLEELQKIAQDRGYKSGWARHVYNSRKK